MNSNTDLHFALEAKYYTSPDLFEKERSSLQSKTWLFACHESEIPNEGDYYAFELCGENLFVIRGKDGQERTFYNVCQHRAHQLVKRKGNCRLIICPYHSWTYELEGKLRSGPNLNAIQNLDRDGIKLQQVKTENFHGFIFLILMQMPLAWMNGFQVSGKPSQNMFPTYPSSNQCSGLKYPRNAIGKPRSKIIRNVIIAKSTTRLSRKV